MLDHDTLYKDDNLRR